jgi:hypothetical protein
VCPTCQQWLCDLFWDPPDTEATPLTLFDLTGRGACRQQQQAVGVGCGTLCCCSSCCLSGRLQRRTMLCIHAGLRVAVCPVNGGARECRSVSSVPSMPFDLHRKTPSRDTLCLSPSRELLVCCSPPNCIEARGVNILTGEGVPGRALTGWVLVYLPPLIEAPLGLAHLLTHKSCTRSTCGEASQSLRPYAQSTHLLLPVAFI